MRNCIRVSKNFKLYRNIFTVLHLPSFVGDNLEVWNFATRPCFLSCAFSSRILHNYTDVAELTAEV